MNFIVKEIFNIASGTPLDIFSNEKLGDCPVFSRQIVYFGGFRRNKLVYFTKFLKDENS